MTQFPKLATSLDPRRLLDDAIERAYRAAAGEAGWAEALAAIALAHGGYRAILFTPGVSERDGGICVSHECAPPPFLRSASPPVSSGELDSAHSVVLGADGDPSMPAALLVLFRLPSAAAMSTEQRQSLETCARHFTAALRLWYRARLGKHGAELLATGLNAAAFIVDAESTILWMNARASLWVEGARIAVVQGRLVEVPGLEIDLPRAIRDGAERRRAPHIQFAHGMTLEIVPAAPAFAGRTPEARALVVLRDRGGCREAAAALAANYRLTSSEVDLAMALWKGTLIAEYASQRSVAMSTVRTQLKALLAKTGARRQSDVVAIVASLQPIARDPSLVPPVMADSHYAGRDKPQGGDPSNGG